jgi:putative heme-binding domain-containing protein
VQNFGGRIGPELTTIGKKYERAALLETILEPSKAIAPEYVPYLVETADGRVLLGFLAEKTDQEVVLKDAKGDTVRLAAGEVESMQPQRTSLMPELVLRDITAQDAADLLAFLMTLE